LIVFTNIRYKNILSTGNTWTSVDLNSDKSTLIVGENGSGKSTILDAMSFVLYGKAFRKINKPQLLNSINQRDLMVELSFISNGVSYVIKRGIKPAIFEIWKNDILLNQDASSRDYQAYLEENILKMNFKSFGQVVVLGSSTFIPFMQLPALYRREVIEDLLDIQIFSTMNTLLKDKVLTNKSDSVEVKYQADNIKNKIEFMKEHNLSILKLKEAEIDKIKEKIKTQLTFIKTEETDVAAINKQVTILSDLISNKADTQSKLNQYRTLKSSLNNKLSSLTADINFYHTNDNCPTCKQSIKEHFKTRVIDDKNKKIVEIENAITSINDTITTMTDRFNKILSIESDLQKLKLDAADHIANIRISKSSIMALSAELDSAKNDAAEIDSSQIEANQAEYNSLIVKQQELYKNKEILVIANSILKDGGIKTRIVKQYIPIINKLINKYLAAMDFFVDFQLDESFNEKILSRFRDEFSYSSFSEGEKLRIDLALMLTWRAVSKLRNSVTTNLLIMDEVLDGSLDQAGTDEFLKIIGELTAGSNVFIISHKGDYLYDKFDRVIKFEKKKNFSQIA